MDGGIIGAIIFGSVVICLCIGILANAVIELTRTLRSIQDVLRPSILMQQHLEKEAEKQRIQAINDFHEYGKKREPANST